MIPGVPQVGGMELLMLLLILLLLFGAKRIPGLARSFGTGLGEFRKGISGHYYDEEDAKEERLAGGEAEKKADDVVGQRR